MTDKDWVNYLNEWEESFYGSEESTKHTTPIEEREIVKTDKGRIYPYHYKEMETAKAKFFVTDLTNGKRGFWCPNAAIIEDRGDTVEVADWCELNEINFR